MRVVGCFILLFVTGAAASEDRCSYQDVLNYLNLTRNNDLFYMSRPVKNHKNTTNVHLDVLLYAILDMKEKDQTFIPYVWILQYWNNEYISWDPDDFCGIESVGVPAEIMWKPDITIEEMTEKDKAPPAPHLTITHYGDVELTNDQVLVSTCMMHVYRFPFDIQICNLTFKSVIHPAEELHLHQYANSSVATEVSREVMRTQFEWLFVGMDVTSKTVNNFGFNQSAVVYTIIVKRRSTLYIVNFIVPVLFFLCLDLSSFLISDQGGEKLSFKVTVLLAVTVMQLILNEILPSSSNKIPLIAVYCLGIFGLMLLSLLETIFVMYLTEKDNEKDEDQDCGDKRDTFHSCLGGVNKWIHCQRSLSPGEMPSQPLSVSQERSGNQLMGDSQSSEILSDELKDVLQTLVLILNSNKKEETPGYWSRKTKTINKVFFIFYLIAATVFVVCMFFSWSSA